MERIKKYRCSLCYRYELTLKLLITHYQRNHSKIQIIEYLLKQSFSSNFLIKKRQKRGTRKQLLEIKPKIIYLDDDDVLVTYGDKSLIVNDNSENNNNISTVNNKNVNNNNDDAAGHWLHITFEEESPNIPQEIVELQPTTSVESSSNKSNHCSCNKQKMAVLNDKLENDNDDKTKTVATKFEPSCFYYCNFCTTKNLTISELIEHERIHQFYCDLCNCYYPWQLYQDHFKQHIFRIFICHWCGMEFYSKDILIKHMDQHLDQQVVIDVLNMEYDYLNSTNFHHTTITSTTRAAASSSSSRSSSTSSSSSSIMVTNCDNKADNINSIVQYLMYPGDHPYSRNCLPM